jgi:hypothetical protein
MNNQLISKVVLCAVIVTVCTISLSIGSVFAQGTYSMTVTTDSNGYAPGAIVTINGTVTPATSGVLVGIKVNDPNGTNVYSNIALTSPTGVYTTSFSSLLENAQPTGTYVVLVTAALNGNQVASQLTTFNVTTEIPEFSSTVFITIAIIGGCAAAVLSIFGVKKTPNSKQTE